MTDSNEPNDGPDDILTVANIDEFLEKTDQRLRSSEIPVRPIARSRFDSDGTQLIVFSRKLILSAVYDFFVWQAGSVIMIAAGMVFLGVLRDYNSSLVFVVGLLVLIGIAWFVCALCIVASRFVGRPRHE